LRGKNVTHTDKMGVQFYYCRLNFGMNYYLKDI